MKGQSSGNPTLDAAYQDPLDRIVFGLLAQTALAAPICTEFNFVKNGNTLTLIGLWVRSPEAFNDPKMPPSELKSTVRLLANGAEMATDKLFSRDGSQVFLTPSNGVALPSNALKVEFKYKLWNPMTSVYETKSTVTTDILPVPTA